MRFIASFVALLIAGMAAASPVASDTTATVRSDQSVGLVLGAKMAVLVASIPQFVLGGAGLEIGHPCFHTC